LIWGQRICNDLMHIVCVIHLASKNKGQSDHGDGIYGHNMAIWNLDIPF
jgi:hypothetical protein